MTTQAQTPTLEAAAAIVAPFSEGTITEEHLTKLGQRAAVREMAIALRVAANKIVEEANSAFITDNDELAIRTMRAVAAQLGDLEGAI
jgi:hypothetical protein